MVAYSKFAKLPPEQCLPYDILAEEVGRHLLNSGSNLDYIHLAMTCKTLYQRLHLGEVRERIRLMLGMHPFDCRNIYPLRWVRWSKFQFGYWAVECPPSLQPNMHKQLARRILGHGERKENRPWADSYLRSRRR